MSPFLKATMPCLNTISKNYMKIWSTWGINVLQSWSTGRPRNSWPIKAAPCRNPARSYAAVAVSLSAHTVSPSKELLTEELLCTLPQLFLRPRSLPWKNTPFLTVTYRKKETTGAPAVITVQPYRTLLPYQLYKSRKGSRLFSSPDLVLKSLLAMLRRQWRNNKV